MSSQAEATGAVNPPLARWKGLLAAGVASALLLAGAWLVQRELKLSRQEKSLQEMLAALDESDPGWRLEDIALPPPLPEHRNSARTVVAAYRLLPKGVPNKLLVGSLLQGRHEELIDARSMESLESDLRRAETALVEARKLADLPEGRHHFDLTLLPRARLQPDQQHTFQVADLLASDALRLAQRGDARQALRSGRAILNAGRSLGDEPFMAAQGIRLACVALAASSIERTLALGEPPAEELEALQKLLALEEAHPTLLVGLRGERAWLDSSLSELARGALTDSEESMSPRQSYRNWTNRHRARLERPEVLRLMGKAIDNARLPPHEQKAAEDDYDKEVKALPQGFLVPLPNHLFSQSVRYKLAQVRCLQALLAVEQHRQAKGTWPVKLEELPSKLLPAVPLDPFDGKPLRYRRVANGVIVYSVGQDRTDDGGDIVPTKPGPARKDFGYRLWNVEQRRQPPKSK